MLALLSALNIKTCYHKCCFFKMPANCELSEWSARGALESRRLLRLYFTCTHCVLTHFLFFLHLPFHEQRAYCSPKCNTGSKDPLGVSTVQLFTHAVGLLPSMFTDKAHRGSCQVNGWIMNRNAKAAEVFVKSV